MLLTLAGIAIPAALLVAAVRRWLAPLSWRFAALLFAAVVGWLHLGALTPAMPVALDEVVRGYPYRGIFGDVVSRNPDTNDTVKQMLPWMEVARQELFAGRAPLWNRYSFSGYPLVGNAQSAPFSPYFLATLFVPLPKQIVAMAGLKLFVSFLFGYLFVREEKVTLPAAVFGSLVFAGSIFQNVYLYYPLSAVTSLLPAMAWASLRLLRGGGRAEALLLAVVTAAAFAGGHPESVFHLAFVTAIIIGIDVLAPLARRPAWSAVGKVVAVAFAGALLAAPAWLPVVEQILASQRIGAIGEGHFGSPVYPRNALWILLTSEGFGNPARGNWSWGLHYIMVAPTYLGLIPLALLPGALLGRGSSARTRLFAVASILMLLIAMRWTPIGEAFNRLPLGAWTANDRIRFAMLFFAGVATARRFEEISIRRIPLIDLLSCVIALVMTARVFMIQWNVVLGPVHLLGFVGLLLFALALGIGLHLRPQRLAALAASLLLVELFLLNLPFNALTPRRYFAPPLPIVEAIRQAAPEEPFRIAGHDWVFLPNASAQYGLEDIRGSDPMAWRPYVEVFRHIQAPDQSLDVGRIQNVEHPLVDFLGVRYLLAGPGAEAGPSWERIYEGKDGVLFENREALPRFFAPASLIEAREGAVFDQVGDIEDFRDAVVVEDVSSARNPSLPGMWLRQMAPGSFRMTMTPANRTFIASSQPAVPGYEVEVDGEPVPIHRVNGAFIGFFVPAGEVRVRVRYEPDSWWTGWGMTLFGALTLGLATSAKRGSESGLASLD